MTYYQQVYSICTNYIKSYRTDLVNHLQDDLIGFSGDFIMGYRSSGCDILKLDKESILEYGQNLSPDEDITPVDVIESSTKAFVFSNDEFLIGSSGKVNKVSRAEAVTFYRQYIPTFEFYFNSKTAA